MNAVFKKREMAAEIKDVRLAGRQEQLLLEAICQQPHAKDAFVSYTQSLIAMIQEARALNVVDPVHGYSPLSAACRFLRDEEVIGPVFRSLVSFGASLEYEDLNGASPLHAAIEGGNVSACQMLIRLRADLARMSSRTGLLPVEYAVNAIRYGGHDVDREKAREVLRLLLDARAPVHKSKDQVEILAQSNPDLLRQNSGCLILASGGNDHGNSEDEFEIVRWLLSAGANPSLKESGTGRQALHYAAMRGFDETVLALIEYGADVMCKDSRGMMPHDYAEQFSAGRVRLRAILRAFEMRALTSSSGLDIPQKLQAA